MTGRPDFLLRFTFPSSSSAITSRSGIWPGSHALQDFATNSGEVVPAVYLLSYRDPANVVFPLW